MSDAHAQPAGHDGDPDGRDPAAVVGDADSALIQDPGTAHPPLAPELREAGEAGTDEG